MKITCTEEEKSGIIFMLAEGKSCFLPFKCTYYSNKECQKCIERNIEWEIVPEGSEQE